MRFPTKTLLSYFTDKETDLGNLPNITQLAKGPTEFWIPATYSSAHGLNCFHLISK